ncbi:MAG: indole-3-glycerol-phosphate synthase [Candidatus Bipolaricaulia bacterium]
MDYLDRFAEEAQARIASGYYRVTVGVERERRSFVEAIAKAEGNAIIAELKPASPSAGELLGARKLEELAWLYRAGGAVGLSALTEPEHFRGSLEHLRAASELGLPVLMKDFILDPAQLEACACLGGDCVLLILSLFRRGYSTTGLGTMIAHAHQLGLEVLLEVASAEEFQMAQRTDAEMIGLNSRDLATLEVDLDRTIAVLESVPRDDAKVIWALSGISSLEEVRRLRAVGAKAFLVGTALMRADDPLKKLEELIRA